MLKITTQMTTDRMVLQLEGKLTGPWLKELACCWEEVLGSHQPSVLVDLTDVTFIDSDGQGVLARMWQQGATFRTAGCLNTSILEEITAVNREESRSRQADQ